MKNVTDWTCAHCGTVYSNYIIKSPRRECFMDSCCNHFYNKKGVVLEAFIQKVVQAIKPTKGTNKNGIRLLK